jgi:hypothetical protein
MYEEHAKPILDLLHKDIKRGVITSAETANAISLLEAAISENKKLQDTDKPQKDDDVHHDDDEEAHTKVQPVSFSTRVYPLLEMLRAAHDGGNDVMWGV